MKLAVTTAQQGGAILQARTTGANMGPVRKTTARGRAQDRARVARDQEREARSEAEKTDAKATDVKRAVKSEGNSRKKVENARAKKSS
jgi:hypothetical protein